MEDRSVIMNGRGLSVFIQERNSMRHFCRSCKMQYMHTKKKRKSFASAF